jgi:hypothetical protein
LLTVGFLSSAACVALLIDMTVATLTSSLSTIPKGLSLRNWLDDFLYLPEVLYVLFFIWLICSGPGSFRANCPNNCSLTLLTRFFEARCSARALCPVE